MIRHLSIEDILRTGDVERWHIVRTYRTQTLAEHMYRVTMLALKLSDIAFGEVPTDLERDLLWHGLTHDLHEIDYGDIPTPAKELLGITDDTALDAVFWQRRKGQASTPSDTAKLIIKLADKLEGLLFFMQNAPHQNVHGVNVADKNVSSLVDLAKKNTTKDTNWLKVIHTVLTDLGFKVNIKDKS